MNHIYLESLGVSFDHEKVLYFDQINESKTMAYFDGNPEPLCLDTDLKTIIGAIGNALRAQEETVKEGEVL